MNQKAAEDLGLPQFTGIDNFLRYHAHFFLRSVCDIAKVFFYLKLTNAVLESEIFVINPFPTTITRVYHCSLVKS